MLFGHLLTHTAQVYADVRTYWSPAVVRRVTGYQLTGAAANGLILLINSGAPRWMRPIGRSAAGSR